MLKPLGKGVVVASLMSLAVATNAAETPQVKVFHTAARVEIDAQGQVAVVTPDSRLSSTLSGEVIKAVQRLEFAAARKNGTPVAGVTYVNLMGCAVPTAEGFQVALGYASHGPGRERTWGPPPFPADALRKGYSASFNVVIVAGADGRGALERMEETTPKGPIRERAFRPAIEAWAKAMRFEPEVVDGQALATRMSFPVEFSAGDDSPRGFEEAIAARQLQSDACQTALGKARHDPKRAVVLDSPFALKNGG